MTTLTLETWALVYWRGASRSRHPTNDIAMHGQALLWGVVTSGAPPRIRQAADNHLRTIAEHPDPERVNGQWSAI